MKNEIEQELQKIQDKLKPPSIAILGRSGAGKSSLIKAIFNLNDIQIDTGAGLPKTQHYRKYPHPEDENTPVILYDSPGFEADKTDVFLEETITFLSERIPSNPDNNEKIHLIWYLIHAGLGRIERFDEKVIQTASSLGIPVIIILSQSDIAKKKETEQLNEAINKLQITNTFDILKISSEPLHGEPFGLEELVDISIKKIPEIYTKAFIISQTVNIKEKRKVAWMIVSAVAGACFGSAFIPVPGSSPAAVIISQTSLLKVIAQVYNFNKIFDGKTYFATFSISTLLAILGTSIVDAVSTTLLPLPTAFFALETVSATVASSYIVAVGLALIFTFEKLLLSNLESKDSQESIKDFFKKTFSIKFNEFTNHDITIRGKSDLDNIRKKYIE
ncbi:50S ribosome-binding GTPase [Plectonema cf. radiosum LEGE 06105]|uniref:50S ribosome-binding GTPase n=1 Tax=Plectonema cf. radiosum LEGE 06105 TaxID=945769 RepID=A0A8J7EZH2_9CYAN|nr:GTPase [Plectonema radiosum]MBE9211727.1 50S ribosome-binding GTPase [Plectonema cf. radiosum LEGE 06105]